MRPEIPARKINLPIAFNFSFWNSLRWQWAPNLWHPRTGSWGGARIYTYNCPPYPLFISFSNYLGVFPKLVNAFAFCFPWSVCGGSTFPNSPNPPQLLAHSHSHPQKCVREVLCHREDKELGDLPVSTPGRLGSMEVGGNILRYCQLK